MTTPRELKSLFEKGKNICEYMRYDRGLMENTAEIIELAYDLQAGSYSKAMEDISMLNYKNEYTFEIARIIRSLCNPDSILEAGVGEATTLSGVLSHLGDINNSYGFDLSWSRVACARLWLNSQGINSTNLCVGNLLSMPYANNSIDIVYTSHSIEPNRGKEEQILCELYRVTKKYLILLEPGYEFANNEARQRMDHHGYCKDISGKATHLGFNVLEHKLFPCSLNPLNPTAITIIKKNTDIDEPNYVIACPKYKTSLDEIGGALFSAEGLLAYPIIGGIPCLRIENGILASKFLEVFMRI